MSGQKLSLDLNFDDCRFEDFAKKCHKNLQMVKDKMLIVAANMIDEEKAIDYSKFLLGMGANINGEIDGESPIYAATRDIMNGETDLVAAKWLVENGVYVNGRDYIGWTPLLQAAEHSDLEYVKLLVEKGADVNAITDSDRDCDKSSVLSLACDYSSLEIIKYLIEKGAKIDVRPPDGRTPLICACDRLKKEEEGREVDIVKYLLEMGADATIADNEGLTPLAHAKINKKEKLVEILLKHLENLKK